MKIGIDVRLWNETGVGRYIRNLVKYLQIIDKENEYVLFALSKNYGEINSTITNSRLQVINTDIRWHSIDEQLRFPVMLYKAKLDLMHFPYFSLPVLYNKPFVVTIHDLIIYKYPTGEASTLPLPLYKIKHFAYKKVIKRAVNNAQKIIVPLHSVKKDLIATLDLDEGKIAVTNEGVDESITISQYVRKVSDNDLKDKKYFLYVGNAYPHKNLETLIKAFLVFREKMPSSKVELYLVGKDDFFYSSLRNPIKPEHKKFIKFYHNLDDVILGGLYRHALAVVTPSFMEGFGLVPLEAMANNCLVIASDIPSHREVCSDAAIFFNPLNRKELIKHLSDVAVYINSPKYQMKIKKGSQRVNVFSWKKMAEKTKKIYENCISL